MERSNCFIYAMAQWIKYGGYVAVRRCAHHPFCIHWLHSKDLVEWTQYTGEGEPPSWLGKLWYKGYVKVGDGDV